MYPSDYAYTFANRVNEKCYMDTYNCYTSTGGAPSNSWLYKSGNFLWTFVGNVYGVCPVVYLKPDIKLIGSGTSMEPYKIIG